jgi:hypothetical protein
LGTFAKRNEQVMILEKTNFSIDLDKMLENMQTVLKYQDWPESPLGTNLVGNQISLRHRPNEDGWLDGIGSLKNSDGVQFAEEKDFTVWHKDLPEYTKYILDQLQEKENVKFGRVRYMRLMPKTGLRVHFDFESRYHLALVTNKFAMFGHYYEGSEEVAKCYHIPSDGAFYKVDTTLPHFVYNGSTEERIHLVCCVVK